MPINPTVVFTAARQITLEDRPMPTPGAGEVLIRTTCTLISTGTELSMLAGDAAPDSIWGKMSQFPLVPGYDNVGRIIAVGTSVDPSLMGKRCATYGPHALHHVQPAASARFIDAGISDEQAVFFTLAEIVMNGVRRSGLRWGESAAVFGLGLLGQLTVRLARIAGARPVIGVDVADARLARLPADKGVVGLNAARDDVPAAVLRHTRGRKADVVFELTGNAKAIPAQLAALRNQGRFVILSSPRGKTDFDFHDLCNAPSVTIIGVHNSSHPPHETPDNPWTHRRDCELFFDLVAAGELDMTPLVSHRSGFADAPALYRLLLEDRTRAMGIVLNWGEAG